MNNTELEDVGFESEPGAKFRQFENLIGRISSIDERELFSLLPVAETVKNYKMFHPTHKDSLFNHSLAVAANINHPVGRIAGLMHDWGKVIDEVKEPNINPNPALGEEWVYKHPNHQQIGAELACDCLLMLDAPRETTQLVCKLVRVHDHWGDELLADELASEVRGMFSDEELEILFELQVADLEAHDPEYAGARQLELLRSQSKIMNAAPLAPADLDKTQEV
ncbi:MAG: HD domain-containing protein [Candidatus Nomurabacteria bacterium]|jgi:HD superfamily phosphodiesterase|nr:HD domain-containing protein [Candidatus Nomurabacteria bacterium]